MKEISLNFPQPPGAFLHEMVHEKAPFLSRTGDVITFASCPMLCVSKMQTEFCYQPQGDTGKCIHFPYLMFSIIKMISDHIIEKINLILVLYFIWKLISNFNSDTGFHTNFLYLDFLIKIQA